MINPIRFAKLDAPRDFVRFQLPFWIMFSAPKLHKISNSRRKDISNFEVSTVPTDDLATGDGRVSAGRVET